MKAYSIAILVFGEINAGRNALIEDKYKDLALAFNEKGVQVDSVIYNDLLADQLATELLHYQAILVWVNPIEQGNDRKRLDALLMELSKKGCLVSSHPETILKIGTKDILYKTRDMDLGGDVRQYASFDEFKERFLLSAPQIRILKQYRGNGGNGVFKINTIDLKNNMIGITHAAGDEEERVVTETDLLALMKYYFANNGILIDQPWNANIINGMVRCYLTGAKVSGFGYQEINALYPSVGSQSIKPGKRFYFSEQCGLFRDLKNIMESKWVPQIQKITSLPDNMLPVIWDADFFINEINTQDSKEKYELCEINVSCVSPFPESAIPYIIEEVGNRIKA